MARIDRQITPLVKVFPLKGLTTTLRENSGIPRAVVNIEAPIQTVTGPGAGNNMYIYGTASLPTGYAYAYLGTTISCSQLTILLTNNTWHWPSCLIDSNNPECPELELNVTDRVATGTADGHYDVFVLESNTRVYTDESTPSKQIVWSTSKQSVTSKFGVLNKVNDTGDMKFHLAQRFLQYDISQTYDYIVNNAVPVR